MSWEDFTEIRMMQPLGFKNSAASVSRLKDASNSIRPHAPVNGKIEVLDIDWSETANAAGGIWSNIIDESKWVIMQMNHGKYGEGLKQSLFSENVHEEMWSAQTNIGAKAVEPYNTHFAAYGLGWFLSDVKGYKQVTHTGGLAGIVTQVVMIPEINLGIIVLTNQQSGAAFSAISNTIKDGYLGVKGYNWVKLFAERVAKAEAEAKKINDEVIATINEQAKKSNGSFNIEPYVGKYTDQWFGEVEISSKEGKPWFASKRSPKLSGELFPYKGNTLIVRWTNKSMDADAFVIFSTDKDGKPAGIKMNAISPLTDFSFDFQDLDFKKL